jgi:hypothetical protein
MTDLRDTSLMDLKRMHQAALAARDLEPLETYSREVCRRGCQAGQTYRGEWHGRTYVIGLDCHDGAWGWGPVLFTLELKAGLPHPWPSWVEAQVALDYTAQILGWVPL